MRPEERLTRHGNSHNDNNSDSNNINNNNSITTTTTTNNNNDDDDDDDDNEERRVQALREELLTPLADGGTSLRAANGVSTGSYEVFL